MLIDHGRDLLALAVALVLALVGAAFIMPVHVRRLDVPPRPRRPPGTTLVLGVSNRASRYAWSLDMAMAAWDASGVRIRLEHVPASRARIVVTMARHSTCGSDPDTVACTDLGHPRGVTRTIWIVTRLDKYDEARVLAHELGHVYGLTHDTSHGCVVMTPQLSEFCPPPPAGEWRCRLLSTADVKRAVAIDGGTVEPFRGPIYCPKRGIVPPT